MSSQDASLSDTTQEPQDCQNGGVAIVLEDGDHAGARPRPAGLPPCTRQQAGESAKSDDSDVDKLETWRAAGLALRETLDKLQRNSDKHLKTDTHVRNRKKSESGKERRGSSVASHTAADADLTNDAKPKGEKASTTNPSQSDNSTPRRRHCRAKKSTTAEALVAPADSPTITTDLSEQPSGQEPTLAELTQNLHQRLQQINATLPLSSPLLLANKKAKHSPRTSRLSSTKADDESRSSSSNEVPPCTCQGKKAKNARKHHRYPSQGKQSDLTQTYSPTSPRRSNSGEVCERCGITKSPTGQLASREASPAVPVDEPLNTQPAVESAQDAGNPVGDLEVLHGMSDSDSEVTGQGSASLAKGTPPQLGQARGIQVTHSQGKGRVIRHNKGFPGGLVETDSAANLADIESLCEDETEDTESYMSRPLHGFMIGDKPVQNNSSEKETAEEKVNSPTELSAATEHFANHASDTEQMSPTGTLTGLVGVCGSPLPRRMQTHSSTDEEEAVAAQISLEKYRKDRANIRLKKMISTDQEEENPGFGVGDDSLEDMSDLHVAVDSDSPDGSAVKLSQTELDSFSDLHISAVRHYLRIFNPLHSRLFHIKPRIATAIHGLMWIKIIQTSIN